MDEFLKISIIWKVLKHFIRSKQRAALRKSFGPTPDKSFLTSLEQKCSYEDTQEYTNICFPIASRMQFLDF